MSNNKLISYSRKLVINGVELTKDRYRLIQNISLVDNASGSDLLTIIVADPDLVFVDDDIFIKDVPVAFYAEVSSYEETHEFNGYISALDIDFDANGVANLTIYCMDNSYLMNRTRKSRTWAKVKASDVVRDIMSKDYPSFQLFIEDTEEITQAQLEQNPSSPNPLVQDSTTQTDQTDMEFFLSLAQNQIEDYICYVYKNEFHFEKRKMVQTPQATIWYKQSTKDIITFKPQINREVKKQEVTAQQISLVTSKLSSFIANDISVDRDLQGSPIQTSSVRS